MYLNFKNLESFFAKVVLPVPTAPVTAIIFILRDSST